MLVLDASALVELVVAGEHRAGADALLERYEHGEVLVTAAHGLVESANAMRRLARQRALSDTDASRAIGWLGEVSLVLDATGPRLRRVWDLRDRMSAYDAAYAATAEALHVPLVSTDRPLLKACAAAGVAAAHLADLEA